MSNRSKTNDGFIPPSTPQPPVNNSNRPNKLPVESGFVPPSTPVKPQPTPKKK